MATTTVPEQQSLVGYKASSDREPSQDTLLRCDPDRTRAVSSIYGTCCQLDSACQIPTTCLAGTLFYDGSTRPCSSASSCASLTVLSRSADDPDTDGMTVDYFCNPTSTEWKFPTLYLEDPVAQTSQPATTSTATETDGNLNDSSPSSDSSSSGKAWIAGAVIGPVALLALLVAGGIFLWRRRRATQSQQQHPPDRDEAATKAELEGSQGNMIAGVLGAAWQKPELDDGQRQAELRRSQADHLPELSPDATVYELDASSRGPHELAPDAFQRSELGGPPSTTEARG